ncbi:hypothetical protein CLF_103379 [Clonorchis sinensis]|uniref:Uncharacterized protein n=1 Tax=Clonorchis sinensis TaxID=79923 RepID=G7Y9N5_CLOSI|nr:hypothetical protein CLF_103379 [Clonorchis sinensis]
MQPQVRVSDGAVTGERGLRVTKEDIVQDNCTLQGDQALGHSNTKNTQILIVRWKPTSGTGYGQCFLKIMSSELLRKRVASLKSVDYETRLAVHDLFLLKYHRLRWDLTLTYALFEQGLDSGFFTVNPANTRKRGYLAKVCRSAPVFVINSAVTNQVTRSETPEYMLHATATSNRARPPYHVEINVNNVPANFELNTDSAVTLCIDHDVELVVPQCVCFVSSSIYVVRVTAVTTMEPHARGLLMWPF